MIASSELILNPDGSVYHLNLQPGQVANDIIFVGDQNRVEKITKHFDSIEFSTQKREFKTQTGIYKGKWWKLIRLRILQHSSESSKSLTLCNFLTNLPL